MDMDETTINNINLIDVLSEKYSDVPDLPEACISSWNPAQITAYYESGGSTIPSSSNKVASPGADIDDQPGGSVDQTKDPATHRNTPAHVRANQFAATVLGYRAQAIADGLPFRPHGLFPPCDPLLRELAEDPAAHPFEKHLAGERSPYELLKNGSWTSGDEAAQAGFDMRLFYKVKQRGEQYGTIVGAARLGDRASIGNGYWMSAHGGAVESLLDEATAELGKMEFSPMLSTIEADFKIKKSVPLHTTLRIECQIKETKGMRCWVDGYVKDLSGVVLASCVAQLVDLQQLWAAQGQTPPI